MMIMMTTELVVSNYSSVVVTTFTFLSFFFCLSQLYHIRTHRYGTVYSHGT